MSTTRTAATRPQILLDPDATTPTVPGVLVVWESDSTEVREILFVHLANGIGDGKERVVRRYAAAQSLPVVFIPVAKPDQMDTLVMVDPKKDTTTIAEATGGTVVDLAARLDNDPPQIDPLKVGAASHATGPIVVACDGSSLSNPGHAGWAWFVDANCWAADAVPLATNNAMELTAVLRFLQAVADRPDVETVIRCDSKYVIDGVTKWSKGWVRNGWVNSAKKEVANKELFQQILAVLAPRTATRFEWVKGHAGDPLNEAADSACTAAAFASQSGTRVITGPGWVD